MELELEVENDVHSTQIVRVGDEEIFFSLGNELIEDTRVEEGIVEITVTRGVPVLLVVIGALWTGKQGVFEDTGIAGLIKGGDAELLVRILFDDAEGVLMGIERGHENERDVDAVGGVEMLDLTDSEIKEGHVVLDFEGTLCTGHSCDNQREQTTGVTRQKRTHGGTKTTVNFENGKLFKVG